MRILSIGSLAIGSLAFMALLAVLAVAAPSAALAGGNVIASGQFTGKSNHATTGGVTIAKTDAGLVVILEDSFSFDGAPDPKVGFGNSGSYDSAAQLSHLNANSGRQVYQIPASVDPTSYNEIYIWCEQYSVPLGVAKLK